MPDIEKGGETASVSDCASQNVCYESKTDTQSHDGLIMPSSPMFSLTDSEHHPTCRNVPEDGGRAWIPVFGAFVALFCTFGQMNAFGTFQSWYATHQLQHLPASTISWIGSLQLWVFFFSVCSRSGGFKTRVTDDIVGWPDWTCL
jgi:hypothetical protein